MTRDAMQAFTPRVEDWVCGALGSSSRIVSTRRLPFSSSSSLFALQIEQSASVHRLVLRLHTNAVWLAEEPDLPGHEAAALRIAGRSGLPVPRLVALDSDGTQAGIPALLMTQLPGQADLRPPDLDDWLRGLASLLPPLHALNDVALPYRFAPYFHLQELSVPGWSSIPDEWERAIRLAQSPPPPTSLCFIHRDFHPVNVLWEGGQVSGLVDWPNACLGPAGVDISWARMNLSAMYGVAVADAFLAQYERITGAESGYHPYWDLLAIMDIMTEGPSVYPPWVELGLQNLSVDLMRQRADEFLVSILQRWNA